MKIRNKYRIFNAFHDESFFKLEHLARFSLLRLSSLSKYVDFSKNMSIICIKSSNQNAIKTRDSSSIKEVCGKVLHNEPPRRDPM